MLRRLALALLIGLAPLLARADHLPYREDRGGSVLAYALNIAERQDTKVLTGYCSSACTMWLGYDRACIHLPATFGFHEVGRDFTGLMQRVYERHLPTRGAAGGLRAWYRAHAAGSATIVRLSGAEILRRGWARECPRN